MSDKPHIERHQLYQAQFAVLLQQRINFHKTSALCQRIDHFNKQLREGEGDRIGFLELVGNCAVQFSQNPRVYHVCPLIRASTFEQQIESFLDVLLRLVLLPYQQGGVGQVRLVHQLRVAVRKLLVCKLDPAGYQVAENAADSVLLY